MPFQFTDRLCQRPEPERGCLARVISPPPPKNSSPILDLPAEIRAQIFEYIISDIDLKFRIPKALDLSTCWTSRPEYQPSLAFLETCRLFEAEALQLVKITAISVDVEPPAHPGFAPSLVREVAAKYRRSRQQQIPLCLGIGRPHLRRLTVDCGYSLNHLLQSDFFDSFPKLRRIRIKQHLWPREIESTYRDAIKSKSEQQRLIKESTKDSSSSQPCRLRRSVDRPQYDYASLGALLCHEKLIRFFPLHINVSIEALQKGDWACGDDWSMYPIRNAVSAVRMTYEWPSKCVTNLEVDVYNQPMALAIKSQWTETIVLNSKINLEPSHVL